MSYTIVSDELAGQTLEFNHNRLQWTSPNDNIEQRLVMRGGSVVYVGGAVSDVLEFDAVCSPTSFATLQAIQKLRRIVTFKSDVVKRRASNPSATGADTLYVVVDQAQYLSRAGLVQAAAIHYPYHFRLIVRGTATTHRRVTTFEVTPRTHTFSAASKTLITLPTGATASSQTVTGNRAGEDGAIPYVNNPEGNADLYTISDADLGKNDVQVGFDGNEVWMKNGTTKIQSRNDEVTSRGGFDLYCWSAGVWTLVGIIELAAFDDFNWYSMLDQVPTVEPGVARDPENGVLIVTWSQTTSCLGLQVEIDMRRGRGYVDFQPTNVGIPNIKAVCGRIVGASQPYYTRLGSTLTANSETGSVTLDASVAQATGAAAAASTNANLNHAANVSIVVAVAIRNGASQTVSTVTCAGVAAALLTTITNGTEERVEYWYIFRSGAGDENIIVTLSAAAHHAWVAQSFVGTAQQAPFFDPNSYVTTTGTGTAVATSSPITGLGYYPGQMVLQVVAAKGTGAGAPTITEGGGQTEIGETGSGDAAAANNVRVETSYKAFTVNAVASMSATLSASTTYAGLTIILLPRMLELATGDDRNYCYLASASPLAAGTIIIGVFCKSKANDRYYQATDGGANCTAVSVCFNQGMTLITPAVETEWFSFYARRYEDARDDPSDAATEVLMQVDQSQDIVETVLT
jgi:hypothetical protein